MTTKLQRFRKLKRRAVSAFAPVHGLSAGAAAQYPAASAATWAEAGGRWPILLAPDPDGVAQTFLPQLPLGKHGITQSGTLAATII